MQTEALEGMSPQKVVSPFDYLGVFGSIACTHTYQYSHRESFISVGLLYSTVCMSISHIAY